MNSPDAASWAEGPPIQREVIDRLRRLGQTAGGEELLALMITRFREEAARWQAEIRACLAAGDLAAILRIAHTLRGSASIFGAHRLVQVCGELEACAAGGNASGCEGRLPSFEDALSEVLAALRRVDLSPDLPPDRE